MRVLNFLILMLIPLKGFSCLCAFHDFESACHNSPHIFEGRIIEKINNKQDNPYYPLNLYKVAVLDSWKGKLKDTVDLYTGIGGGDCGTAFEIGKAYLIWTSVRYGELLSTDFCTRTSLIDNTPDIDLLNYKFKNMAYDSVYLTRGELNIIKSRISNDSIDLTKVSLFMEGNKLLTKAELIDAVFRSERIEYYTVPPRKLKLLPKAACNGVLLFHGYHKRLRSKQVIKSLKA